MAVTGSSKVPGQIGPSGSKAGLFSSDSVEELVSGLVDCLPLTTLGFF
jgi:hypothetical protein